MKKEKPTLDKFIDAHKPKIYKYKFIFHDDEILSNLQDLNYDMQSLDTINNDTLSNLAIESAISETYERDVISNSKKPTMFDNGLVLAKKMIPKAGKTLEAIHIKYFEYNDTNYVGIIFKYESFDILEIFIMI